MSHWIPNRPTARSNRRQHALRLDAPGVPGSEPRPGQSVPEADVQRAVLQILKLHPKVVWAHRFNTGAGQFARDDGTKSRFVRFAFPGCPDVLGQLRPRDGEIAGAILAIEVKSAGGRLRDDQAAVLAMINGAGGCAGVARSAEDAVSIVDRFYARHG